MIHRLRRLRAGIPLVILTAFAGAALGASERVGPWPDPLDLQPGPYYEPMRGEPAMIPGTYGHLDPWRPQPGPDQGGASALAVQAGSTGSQLPAAPKIGDRTARARVAPMARTINSPKQPSSLDAPLGGQLLAPTPGAASPTGTLEKDLRALIRRLH